MTDVTTRRTEARASIAALITEYQDVFGPDDAGMAMLDSWTVVSQWVDMEDDSDWTCVINSGCSWPVRIGMLRIALNFEERV